MAIAAGNMNGELQVKKNKVINLIKAQTNGIQKTASSAHRNQLQMVPKKKSKPRRITISTSSGRWDSKWDCNYVFSLRELQLLDLLDDIHHDTDVSINLCIQKHAGLGLSVEGRIIACITMKCCNCCSLYSREINTTFKVWILPSTRSVRDSAHRLPDIGGGEDPSVVYVKPGYEADLDSLVQDTIRLATSVKETCSQSCEKSEPEMQYFGTRNSASTGKRWFKLLQLKEKTQPPYKI